MSDDRHDPRRPREVTIPARGQRPVLTGRALVLGAVVVLLVVVLASPVHRYLASRSAVHSASRQLQQDRATLKKLQAQQQQFDDPGYIEAQARARLQYAMPGDTVFVVSGGTRVSGITPNATSRPAPGSTAWNQRLWSSVEAAAK